MKKITLFLSLSALLVVSYACNDDNNDKTHYLDNKLVEGKWYSILGKDSSVYTMQDNKMIEEFYAYISGSDTLKDEGITNYGYYQLTDSLILLSSPYNTYFAYRLSNNNDSLYLRAEKSEYWEQLKRLK